MGVEAHLLVIQIEASLFLYAILFRTSLPETEFLFSTHEIKEIKVSDYLTDDGINGIRILLAIQEQIRYSVIKGFDFKNHSPLSFCVINNFATSYHTSCHDACPSPF